MAAAINDKGIENPYPDFAQHLENAVFVAQTPEHNLHFGETPSYDIILLVLINTFAWLRTTAPSSMIFRCTIQAKFTIPMDPDEGNPIKVAKRERKIARLIYLRDKVKTVTEKRRHQTEIDTLTNLRPVSVLADAAVWCERVMKRPLKLPGELQRWPGLLVETKGGPPPPDEDAAIFAFTTNNEWMNQVIDQAKFVKYLYADLLDNPRIILMQTSTRWWRFRIFRYHELSPVTREKGHLNKKRKLSGWEGPYEFGTKDSDIELEWLRKEVYAIGTALRDAVAEVQDSDDEED